MIRTANPAGSSGAFALGQVGGDAKTT
jgi:hypothetical protein